MRQRKMCWERSSGFAGRATISQTTRRVRAGVSLLEVLFSMGIITVGLLGVMIIVPLAGSRSAQGVIADGGDRLGRNAIRAFDVHQMRRPDSWAQYNSSSNTYQVFSGAAAFCIDPLYMTTNSGDTGIFRFPYLGTGTPAAGIPWMTRISLRKRPGATLPSPPYDPLHPTVSRVMSIEQASQIFFGEDDLVFTVPVDRTLPPQQKFDSSSWKRQWEGKFSWLATLVRKQGSVEEDLYVLSVVIFHRRDATIDAERMVNAAPVPATTVLGFNGGDVQLTSTVEDDLKMREGEWLMLAGKTSSGAQRFRWYRIQTGDSGPVANSANTGYERELTLFGQDWPFGEITASGNVTRAIWAPGVVAVYEKTIRLETSSLWTGL
jgi:hypothetical protein